MYCARCASLLTFSISSRAPTGKRDEDELGAMVLNGGGGNSPALLLVPSSLWTRESALLDMWCYKTQVSKEVFRKRQVSLERERRGSQRLSNRRGCFSQVGALLLLTRFYRRARCFDDCSRDAAQMQEGEMGQVSCAVMGKAHRVRCGRG